MIMDGLSLVAAMAAAVASVALGLRAQMLKPRLTSWPDAPACVAWATVGLSIVLGGYVVAIVDGYRATTGEAAIALALAAYAVLLWLNLLRQVRREPAPVSDAAG
jgi:hypothetical protein